MFKLNNKAKAAIFGLSVLGLTAGFVFSPKAMADSRRGDDDDRRFRVEHRFREDRRERFEDDDRRERREDRMERREDRRDRFEDRDERHDGRNRGRH